jgi:hypothetical protein
VLASPIAVVAGDSVVVPDLAEGEGATALMPRHGHDGDPPLTVTIEGALGVLAQMAHRGARHLPPSYPDRLQSVARNLARDGLRRCADDVHAVARLLGPDPGPDLIGAWVTAQVRLHATAERL